MQAHHMLYKWKCFQLFNVKHWAVHFIQIQPEQIKNRSVFQRFIVSSLSNANSKWSLFSAVFYRKSVISFPREYSIPKSIGGVSSYLGFWGETFWISDTMSTVHHNGNLKEKFEEAHGSLNSNFSVQFLEVTFLLSEGAWNWICFWVDKFQPLTGLCKASRLRNWCWKIIIHLKKVWLFYGGNRENM